MKNSNKEERIKGNIKDRTDLILFLLFCAFTLSFTVGYAALNQEVSISGEATFRVEEEIRITSVNLYETTNEGVENYTSKYGKDSISIGVDLKNITSTVTYKVEIINSGSVSMWIESITQEINNNSNMEYVIEGIGIKELINPGDTKEFNVTIKYKNSITTLPNNTNLDTMLRFKFVKPTSTLAQGTSGNSTTTFFNSGPITKGSVEEVTFSPTIEVGEFAIGYWDASYNKDGTVIAWYTDNDSDDLYELTIGGIGEVYAPVNSSYLFQSFSNLNKITFNGYFDTSNTTNMIQMFYSCSSLTSLDLNDFNTSSVTSMYNMFHSCSSLTDLNVSNFDTTKVTSMQGMFNNCQKITKLNVSNFVTDNTTVIKSMFQNCTSLISIDLSNFNTSKVTSLESFFLNCSSLTSVNLSSFDTTNVTSMVQLFYGCKSLISIDITNFNTSKVSDMSRMFQDCSNLVSLNISSFDTSNVTDMSYMFGQCSKIENLDLTNFNTSNVTNMEYMFYQDYKLTYIDLSSFNFTNVSTYTSIFQLIPSSCFMKVKDQTAYDFVIGARSDLTNIQIVGA